MSDFDKVDEFGIPLNEMAIDRSQFQTKIQEKLIGALREYAFVLLAKANNESRWVKHKEAEVERLLLELGDVFDFETSGKWDKQGAAFQAIEYYQDKLSKFITKATNQFERYYHRRPEENISSSELESLLIRAKEAVPS